MYTPLVETNVIDLSENEWKTYFSIFEIYILKKKETLIKKLKSTQDVYKKP